MQGPPRPPCRRVATGDGDQPCLSLAIQHRSPLAAPLAAYQRSRQAVLHTALTHLLDRLSSDPHLLHYLSVGLSRSVFPLLCQQQDPRIPPPVGGLPSGLYQAGQFVPFFRAEADHVEFHFHPLPE